MIHTGCTDHCFGRQICPLVSNGRHLTYTRPAAEVIWKKKTLLLGLYIVMAETKTGENFK